jgi:hypothetical protein
MLGEVLEHEERLPHPAGHRGSNNRDRHFSTIVLILVQLACAGCVARYVAVIVGYLARFYLGFFLKKFVARRW